MNRKGFTLIEVLVALILLIVVTTSIVIGAQSIFDKQKEQEYDEYINTIELAACTYAENENLRDGYNTLSNGQLSTTLKCPDKNNCDLYVTLQDLVKAGYLDENLQGNKDDSEKIIDVINNPDNPAQNVVVRWIDGKKECSYTED